MLLCGQVQPSFNSRSPLELPTTRHDFFVPSASISKKTGPPNPNNPPHADSPAPVETLDALPLPLAQRNGLLECGLCSLHFQWRLRPLLINNPPHGADHATVRLGGRDNGLNLLSRRSGCAWQSQPARGLFSHTGRCECGDLRAAEDRLQREPNGQLQAGSKEGEQVPHGWVEDGVKREVRFQ